MSIALLLLVATIVTIYIILSLIIRKNKRKRDTIFLVLSFVALLTFLFIRASYLDLITYADDFYFLNNCSWADFWSKAYEPFYKILNFIVGRFTADPKILFCIIDVISLLGPLYFIYKNSKNKFLSVLIYLVIGSFAINQSALRQAIAVSLIAFGFNFAIEKRKLPFILSIICAFLFHYMAIVALLIYPIYNWNLKKIDRKIFWLCTWGISTLTGGFAMQFIMQFDKYKDYAGTEFIVGNTGYKLLILYVAIGFLTYLLLKYFCKKNATKNESKLLGIFMLCIIFQTLATQTAIINRVTSYFIDVTVILIPNSIAIIEDKKRQRIARASTFIAILVLAALNNNFKNYTTIFSGTTNNNVREIASQTVQGGNNEKSSK